MKPRICFFTFLVVIYATVLFRFPAFSENVNNFSEMTGRFENPPSEFRSAPLWVWNNDLTETEIDRQLTELKSGGIGGVFIHPRPGLITPYLSDRWFTLVRYTVDKAKELGMIVWLYDENSYPSGFAGGHVPAQMPESYNQGQGLTFTKVNSFPAEPAKYYVILKKTGDKFSKVTDKNSENGKTGEYYLFTRAFYGKAPWFGGFTYVDIIKEGVTDKFIDVTMTGYYKAIGNEFGKTVPGIFTDEPNIAPPENKDCIRWTPSLFTDFKNKFGYDLETCLPTLYEETGDWKKVRHDYYSLLLDLFIERWAKPWNKWCEQNNFQWTGHYWEHEWPNPGPGSDNMAMYAYHHVPSIDILMNDYKEDVHSQFGNVRVVKELGSVANQIGRKRTLSETYGAGGWDLRFEDMKRIGDWEYVLGVNFMNQHLSYVTIMGARKRDHPQSFSYHEPWWGYYKTLGDYFGRLSFAISSGEQINPVLVLEPTTSAWMYYSPTVKNAAIDRIGSDFQSFVNSLEKYQIEYDIGSENLIKSFGSVDNGKFVVGKRAYDIFVIAPGTENLESSTVKNIESYLAGGGKILSFSEIPPYMDGVPSDRLSKVVSGYKDQWINIATISDPKATDLLSPVNFKIYTPEKITGKLFHHRRVLGDGEIVFLVNTSLTEFSTGTAAMRGSAVTEMDLLTGVMKPYPSADRNGQITFSFKLPPAGSLLLYVGNVKPEKGYSGKYAKNETIIKASTPITVKRDKPNSLTLDYCDYKVLDSSGKDVYFYKASKEIFRAYGFEAGNPWDSAVQYKTSILDRNKFAKDSGFEAWYKFNVGGAVDKKSIYVVIERPGLWKTFINDKPLEPRPNEWQMDRTFGVFDIGKYLVSGENIITLKASPMTVFSELEPIYIFGNFSLEVAQKGWHIVPAKPLGLGEWTKYGMPFYSDRVTYAGTFSLVPSGQKFFVRLDKWNGSVADVKVNGKSAGIIGWQPYECDITGLVKNGRNEISVTVIGTLKNLLGPHHNKPAHGLAWPGMFQAAPENQPAGSEYDFIGYGLSGDFSVVEVK